MEVAEAVTKLRVDRSEYDGPMDAADAKFKGFVSSSQAAGAAMAGGFASSAAQVNQSLGGMSSTAATAMQSIAGSGNQALAGLQGLAAGSVQTGQSLSSAAAQALSFGSATQQATGNLSAAANVSNLAGQSLSQLQSLFNANQGAITALGVTIADNRSKMSVMASQMDALTAAGQKNSAEFANLKAVHAGLGRETDLLSKQQGVYRATNAAVAQSIETVSEKSSFLVKLFGQKTNMVATAGTMFMGYDRVLQTFLGSIGGVSLGVSLLITAFGFLIPKLFGAKKEQEDLHLITEKLVESDVMLASAFQRLAGAAGAANPAFNQLADRFRQLIESNLDAQLLSYSRAYDELEKKITEFNQTGAKQAEINSLIASTQAQLNAANNGMLQTTQRLDVVLDSLGTQLDDYNKQLTTAGDASVKAGEAQEKATKTALEQASALANAGLAAGKSAEEIHALGQKAGFSAEKMGFLTQAVDQATSAFEQLSRAAQSYRPPNLNATLEQLPQLREQINKDIADLERHGKTQSQILVEMKPRFEAYKKGIAEKTAAELTDQGVVMKGAAAQRLLADRLREGGDKAAEYAGKIPALERNLSALTSTSAGAAHRTKTAWQSMGSDTTGIIRNWVASMGFHFENLQQIVNRMAPAQRASLLQQASDWADARIKIETQQLLNLTTTKKWASVSEDFYKRMPANIRAQLDKLNSVHTESFIKIESHYDQLNTSLTRSEQTLSKLTQSVVQDLAGMASFSGPRGADPLGALSFEDSATRMFEAISKVREASIKGFGLVDAQQGVASAARAITHDFEYMADYTGLSTSEMVQRTLAALERLKANAPPEAKAAIDAVGKEFQESWSRVTNANERAIRLLHEQVSRNPAFARADLENQMAAEAERAVRTFEEQASRMRLPLEQAIDHVVTHTRQALPPGLQAAGEEAIRAFIEGVTPLPGHWNKILDDLEKATGKWSSDTIKLVRGTAGDVLTILGELNLDGPVREFEKWYRVIDAGTRIVQRVLGEQATGIIGIFQKTQQQVQQTAQVNNTSVTGMGEVMIDFGQIVNGNMVIVDNWGGQVQSSTNQAATATEQGSARMVSAIAKIGAAIGSIAGLVGSVKSGNILGGAVSGGGLGAIIGGLFKHSTLGGLIGLGAGALGGLLGKIFGVGKSELQKLSEEAQKQQLRESMKQNELTTEKMKEEVKQSLIKTSADAAEFFRSLALHIDIPDSVWDAFFEDLDRLMKGFAERMTQWATDFEKEEGKAAERISLVAQAAVNIAAAIEAASRPVNLSQSKVDALGDAWERIVARLDAVEEVITKKQRRHAAKLAESTAALPEFVTNLAGAITAVNDLPTTDVSKFDQLEKSATEILIRSDRLFEQIDRWRLKVTGQSAEASLPILEFWRGLSEVLIASQEQQIPTAADWQRIGDAAKAALDVAFDVFEGVSQEALSRAAELSETANPIAQFLTAMFGTFKASNDAGSAGAIDVGAVRSQAKALIQVAVDLASDISSEMARAGSKLSEDAGKIPSFVSAIFGAIKSGSEARGLTADFASLRLQGRAMFDAVKGLSEDFSPQTLELMRRTAEAGEGIAAFTSNLSQAVVSTREASQVSEREIGAAVVNFGLLVRHVATLRLAVGTEIFSAAEEVSRRAVGISTNLQSFGNSMSAVSQMKVTSFDPLLLSTAAYLTGLAQMDGQLSQMEALSIGMVTKAHSVEDNLLEVAASLAHGMSEAAGAIGGGSIPATIPIAPPKRGKGGDTYEVHIHAGQILEGRAQFKELVIEAVEEGKQRNRIS